LRTKATELLLLLPRKGGSLKCEIVQCGEDVYRYTSKFEC
jgi:hypothetical protein